MRPATMPAAADKQQRRILRNFSIVNATSILRDAKLQAINQKRTTQMKTNTHAKPNPDNENGLTHGASRSNPVVDDAVLEFAHGKAVRCRAITLQMLETS